jgi:hypothetical protein
LPEFFASAMSANRMDTPVTRFRISVNDQGILFSSDHSQAASLKNSSQTSAFASRNDLTKFARRDLSFLRTPLGVTDNFVFGVFLIGRWLCWKKLK